VRDRRINEGHFMAKAIFNGAVIAESDHFEKVEGNYYFPRAAVSMAFLRNSDTKTLCPWKGTASYYDVDVGGKIIKDGAWYYPSTKEAAKHIEGYVAFWRGVTFED
jgi:uncharacterized protein (DUF427 family)